MLAQLVGAVAVAVQQHEWQILKGKHDQTTAGGAPLGYPGLVLEEQGYLTRLVECKVHQSFTAGNGHKAGLHLQRQGSGSWSFRVSEPSNVCGPQPQSICPALLQQKASKKKGFCIYCMLYFDTVTNNVECVDLLNIIRHTSTGATSQTNHLRYAVQVVALHLNTLLMQPT